MKNFYAIVTLSALVFAVTALSPLDYVLPSLEDFYPSDSGPWYYDHITIAFIPFPIIPHYQVDVDIIQLPNGKIANYVIHLGDGIVKGRIVDTTTERSSVCELTQPASDMMNIAISSMVTNFCGQIRSLRRTTEATFMIVVLCPSGSESLYFNREKPSLIQSFLPFGIGGG